MVKLLDIFTNNRKMCIVPDVHGRYERMKDILDQVEEYDGKLYCIFLGDLCDRGPDSYKCFKAAKEIVDNGDGICIKGNHEDMMVKSLMNGGERNDILWLMNGGIDTVISFAKEMGLGDYKPSDIAYKYRMGQTIGYQPTRKFEDLRDKLLDSEYVQWAKDMPIEYETKHLYFSHAPQISYKNVRNRDLMWNRIRTERMAAVPDGKKASFHGHQHGLSHNISIIRRVKNEKNGEVANLCDAGGAFDRGNLIAPIIDKEGNFLEVLTTKDFDQDKTFVFMRTRSFSNNF